MIPPLYVSLHFYIVFFNFQLRPEEMLRIIVDNCHGAALKYLSVGGCSSFHVYFFNIFAAFTRFLGL